MSLPKARRSAGSNPWRSWNAKDIQSCCQFQKMTGEKITAPSSRASQGSFLNSQWRSFREKSRKANWQGTIRIIVYLLNRPSPRATPQRYHQRGDGSVMRATPQYTASAQKSSRGVSGVWIRHPAEKSSVTLAMKITFQEIAGSSGERRRQVRYSTMMVSSEHRRPPIRTKNS
jgi:hypothetical protein